MSTHIHIENYESFYLDFLEGNLNERDTEALMAFLEAHPDLIVEEDALAYLPEAEFVPLDNQSKLGLKFPDTEQKIGINNIEIFLIASVEKQLPEAKSLELQAFLNANPYYMDELSLYQRSKLQADLSIVYPEKKSLKKGGIIIPMYARFAAAAASVIIAISLFNFGGDPATPQLARQGKKPHPQTQQAKDPRQAAEQNVTEPATVHVIEAYTAGSGSNASQAENLAQANPSLPEANIIEPSARDNSKPLKFKKTKPVSTSRPLFIEPELAHTPLAAQKEIIPTDQESYAMVEMKNPIQAITNRISEVIKRDVDFKTSKAARQKSGGFYLKIGKFEISRKVYDNTSVAAK